MKKSVCKLIILPSLLFGTVSAVAEEKRVEEVIVTSSKVEIPLREVGASVSLISKEDIQLQGYHGVADVLRTQPGIAVSNSGGRGKATTVRIRGEEGFRTLILIDGIDVTDTSLPQASPQAQHLDTSSEIERIEVLRGPQGFIYGADAGGVINILTQAPSQGVNGEIALESGRYNSNKVTGFVAGGNATTGLLVALNNSRTTGFDLSESKGFGPIEEDGYENTTVHSKLYSQIGKGLRAELVIRDTTSQTEFDSSNSNDGLSDFDQTAGRISLSYEDESFQQRIAFQHSDTKSYHDLGFYDYVSEGASQALEYLGGISQSDKILSAVWGAEIKSDELTAVDRVYEQNQKAVFTEVRAAYENALFGSVGFRYDHSDDYGEHLSVRLSSAYVQSLSERIELKYRTSLGSGFRAPSLYEISKNDISRNQYGEDAVPSLVEESSSGFDLGLDVSVGDTFSAGITYFNQVIEDPIGYMGFEGTYDGAYFQQYGVGHSKGFELNVDWALCSHLNFLANYTRNETLTPDDTQRIRRPKHYGNASLKISLFGERVNALVSARFARDAIDTIWGVGEVPLDDYHVVDLSLNYRLEENVTVLARLENAADKHYQEVVGYDVAEAAFYIGLRVNF